VSGPLPVVFLPTLLRQNFSGCFVCRRRPSPFFRVDFYQIKYSQPPLSTSFCRHVLKFNQLLCKFLQHWLPMYVGVLVEI
jgi:hypothetical protein